MRRSRIALTSKVLLCLGVVSGVQGNMPYRVIEVSNGGTIAGLVRLKGDTPKPIRFEIPKSADWCGTTKRSPRLVVGPQGEVANAVISLEGVARGKAFERAATYVLDQRKCEYVPHVLLLPTGSGFEIVNSDAVLHNVHTYAPGKEPRTVFNIAQPVKGLRFPIKADKLKMPGIYHATCDAGHPWMSAYVVVAEHPYYAVTGRDGRFTLPDVPPGTYTLRMWREGVAVTKTMRRNGEVTSYQFEEPYELTQTVTVNAGSTTNVVFELTLRPEVYEPQ